ncbi:hypothetical protein [Pedobacter aquatilis]|uniref:hypothetical protein n=1 Tax=Pedobacter aquatilis TaxID=351343 RepID=UPI0025B2E327|nr:hypothetical protein [Pedobacter aquatilis]
MFRQPGSELCDLLVVCGDDIMIFSDKFCQYPDTGDGKLDWSRWFKRAVAASAKQLWGAEKWIRRDPDRVYVDSRCEKSLRVPIQINAQTRFHLILVAHGSAEACEQAFHGSGSLIIDNKFKGIASHNQPFVVGDLNPAQTFIHVLDDFSLDVVLQTRDTISDFRDYLYKREKLLRSDFRIYAPGEEEMLAHFLKCLNADNEHDFVLPESKNEGYAFKQGIWTDFVANPQRLAQLEADRQSYFWDELIERFSIHTINDTQYYVSEGGYSDGEQAIRFLGQETRFSRRVLSGSVLEMIFTTPGHLKRTRVLPGHDDALFYVVLLFPYDPKLYRNYDEYRETRRAFLTITTFVVRLMNPEAAHVVGIAIESGTRPTAFSEDLVYFDCSGWNQELERQTIEDQQNLQILVSPKRFEVNFREYPDP